VPERGGPNLARRRRLAAELRRIREEDAGFTLDEATEHLGWPSSSKLSRIELGRTGLKQPDLESLLDLYGVTGRHRDDLVALAEESRRAGSAKASSKRLPGEHVASAEDEADSESIWMWEPLVVPGLFQTEAYARALFDIWVAMFSLPPGEVDRRIEARYLRQQVLTRVPAPLVTAILDESVLTRRVGGAAVMHEQLQHLATLAELPHIEFRILPLDGEHIGGAGPFKYLRFRRIHTVPRNDIVKIEHLTGMLSLEDEADTHEYSVVFESLRTHSLGEQESGTLLHAAVAHWNSLAPTRLTSHPLP
jgi:Domain of unknown function (DUF5753)/Helix-turn-helix domain